MLGKDNHPSPFSPVELAEIIQYHRTFDTRFKVSRWIPAWMIRCCLWDKKETRSLEDHIRWDGDDLIVDNVRFCNAKIVSWSIQVPENSGMVVGPVQMGVEDELIPPS